MSTISPSESQYFKELVTPFHPMGRLLIGSDLRDTQCDRFGRGNLRLVGYGDSSGGYAFSPKNQDAAIAPSLFSANLSNIANAIPRLTEVQDMAGKWIDTITLHALDEFIEQTTPQSFTENTFRIFCGGQKDYRGDGTGNRNVRNTFTLLAEVPIPALTRADVPRSFNVKLGVYIPPAQNIYLGLAIPQPYTCSFEMWDLQANTQLGSGFSSSIGGSSTVASGNDLNEDDSNPSADTQFVLGIRFASATWFRGAGTASDGILGNPNVPPPSTVFPETPGTGAPSADSSGARPSSPTSSSSGSSPSSPSSGAKPEVPAPAEGGCITPSNCSWHPVTSLQSAQVDNNLGNSAGLCPKGTVIRGIVDFETSGSFVLCCGADTFPPNDLGCSGIPATTWSCSGGVCSLDASGPYNSQAECQAALIPPNFTGGQCLVLYNIILNGIVTFVDNGDTFVTYSNQVVRTDTGILSNLEMFSNGVNSIFLRGSANSGTPFSQFLASSGGSFRVLDGSGVSITVARVDGLPDSCGNAPPTCPS